MFTFKPAYLRGVTSAGSPSRSMPDMQGLVTVQTFLGSHICPHPDPLSPFLQTVTISLSYTVEFPAQLQALWQMWNQHQHGSVVCKEYKFSCGRVVTLVFITPVLHIPSILRPSNSKTKTSWCLLSLKGPYRWFYMFWPINKKYWNIFQSIPSCFRLILSYRRPLVPFVLLQCEN